MSQLEKSYLLTEYGLITMKPEKNKYRAPCRAEITHRYTVYGKIKVPVSEIFIPDPEFNRISYKFSYIFLDGF